MIVLMLCLSSCQYHSYKIQELTKDTIIHFEWPYDPVFSYMDDIEISYSDIRMIIVLKRYNELGGTEVVLPRGCNCGIYQDSMVVTTANKHKLKILFWKDKN